MTTYNNVLDVFSYAAHTLANTLWSERALREIARLVPFVPVPACLSVDLVPSGYSRFKVL